jgi:ABC-2 type transport system permease protein
MNTFVTQLKREYWENRGGFFRAPMVVIGVVVLITIMGLIASQASLQRELKFLGIPMATMINGLPAEKLQQLTTGINVGLASMSMLVQFALGIVLFFYLIGSLFDERKDRSVLFWKSMPVSDVQTVLTKIVAATLLAPAIAWVAGILLHLLMLGVIGGFFWFNDISPMKLLWGPAEPLKLWGVMLVGIPVNAIWALPSIGWLMLVSSWARGKPFLWAVFVPVIAGILLTWFDALSSLSIPDTWYWKEVFARGLFSIFPWTFDASGAFRFGAEFSKDSTPSDVVSLKSLWLVLTMMKTWLGAAAGIAMLAGAVYFRRYRELSD